MKVTTEGNCVEIVPQNREPVTIRVDGDTLRCDEKGIVVVKDGVEVEVYRPAVPIAGLLSVAIDTSEIEDVDEPQPPPINVWLNNNEVLARGRIVRDRSQASHNTSLPPGSRLVTRWLEGDGIVVKWLVFVPPDDSRCMTLGGELYLSPSLRPRLRNAYQYSHSFPADVVKQARQLAVDEVLYWLSATGAPPLVFIATVGQSHGLNVNDTTPQLQIRFNEIYLPTEGLRPYEERATWSS